MEIDIAALDTAGRDELLQHWRSLIGIPPPKHISRSLLIQILAFEGAVRRMRTRIGLLVQPESTPSIIGATQREQRLGLALNWCVSRSGAMCTFNVALPASTKFTLTVPSNLFAQKYHLYSFLFCHFVCANVIGIDVYNFEFTERKPNPEKVSIIVAS